MKKIIALLIGLILSLAIVFVLPDFIHANNSDIDIEHLNEVSAVPQKVLGYGKEQIKHHKLYHDGKLIGVITDIDYFNQLINADYDMYADDFPNAALGLTEACYIADETSNIIFENIDEKIAEYCKVGDPDSGSYIGVETTAVEFSDSNGVYEIIYVTSQEMFNDALTKFLANFISDSSLEKIRNNEKVQTPTDFGSVDTNLRIAQKMNFSKSIVAPIEIFTTENAIYQFLCYGRDEERQYYETKIGDTVQAVGYHFGDMSARQIMMLNPEKIFNENQILEPGMSLNVTYYKSPIEVYVTKQRLSQQTVLPSSPLYKEDATMKQGSRKIEVEEENGLRNVLYEETWVNGVIQSGNEISSVTIKEPIQGVIAVGTMVLPDVGTGNWRFPTNNAIITCNYVCYANHGGVDFQNLYDKWEYVYAADSGVVQGVGYTDIGGYYVRVDHNNGFVTYYGHMRTYPYVEIGQVVERGEILGPIGMTGIATGPHVHFAMYYNNNLIDPCSVIACNLAWGG